jgi:hypothetical protein
MCLLTVAMAADFFQEFLCVNGNKPFKPNAGMITATTTTAM